MVAQTGSGLQDFVSGGVLQCLEAITLGLPFEVWKTRMGRFRNETTAQAFVNVYRRGGVSAFWAGATPKMIESGSKGAVLMFSKEAIFEFCEKVGMSPFVSGLVAGAGGGACQTTVIGPCTYLVTGAVTGNKDVKTWDRVKTTYKQYGVKGFYPGGLPIAIRQAGNWASREGFTVKIRETFRKYFHDGDTRAKLTIGEEVMSAAIGGTLACWNHPFEVARIEMQSRASAGESREGMFQCLKRIFKENGVRGLTRGIPPRILLSIWQTLFMVTGGKVLKEYLQSRKK